MSNGVPITLLWLFWRFLDIGENLINPENKFLIEIPQIMIDVLLKVRELKFKRNYLLKISINFYRHIKEMKYLLDHFPIPMHLMLPIGIIDTLGYITIMT